MKAPDPRSMEAQTRPWRPLLQGELARRAERALEGVAATLRREEIPPALGVGLGEGLAGLSLFYGYLALARPGEGWEAPAQELLEQTVVRLGDEPVGLGYFVGCAGVAWLVDHLQARVFGGAQDYNAAIDQALLKHLAEGPRPAVYDLVDGFVGMGVYGLGRLHLGSGRELVAGVLRRLDEAAEAQPEGLRWHTASHLLPDWQHARNPRGYYDLGVAHGMPGIIAFLGMACEAGVEEPRARRLLEGAVDWLLAQRQPGPVRFARTLSADGVPEPTASRVSWCYGDLGIALALLGAARRAGRADWEAEALELARIPAGRSCEECEDAGLLEPGLCHGAMGAAQLLHSLHRATGDARFEQGALRWYERALGFWQARDGGEGFRALRSEIEPGPSPWSTDAGFLIGVAGLGLGLIAGLSPVEPAWHRILLIDIPA